MNKLVELYVSELKKENPTMTINQVPVGLRNAVERALQGENIKEGGMK